MAIKQQKITSQNLKTVGGVPLVGTGDIPLNSIRSVSTVNIDSSLTTSNDFVIVTAGVTITLPTSIGNSGKILEIKNISSSSVIINTVSSQTIDNYSTVRLVPYEVLKVISNGSNWYII